jgi:hypothetical protein
VGEASWPSLPGNEAGFRCDVAAIGASVGIVNTCIFFSMSGEADATVIRSPVEEMGRGVDVSCIAGEDCGGDAGQNMLLAALPKRTRVQPPIRTTKKRTGRPLTVRLMRTC